MKTTKRFILTLVAMIIAIGTWAATDEGVVITPAATDNEWTFTMPAGDVELEVEYYTDEELFADGVELTDNGDGTWTLASMPAFDIELEVEYDDTTTAIISIKKGQVDTVTYYDLSGRRVNKPAKGLFIVNGRKVLVK